MIMYLITAIILVARPSRHSPILIGFILPQRAMALGSSKDRAENMMYTNELVPQRYRETKIKAPMIKVV